MKVLSIIVWIYLAAAPAQGRGVRLLDDVCVQKDNITLADLLPPEASQTTRAAAAEVLLGRAPEPGSFRVFTADGLKAEVSPGMFLEFPPSMVVRRPGWPLDRRALQEVLEQRPAGAEFDLRYARVIAPIGITTRTPNARLEVVDIKPSLVPQTLIAQMQCCDRSNCGRFAVQIVLPQTSTAGVDRLVEGGSRMQNSRAVSIPPKSPGEGAFLVQAGRRALLIIDSGNIRITESVVPVRAARAGETVRVNNPLTHRELLAEVVGPGVVRPAASRTDFVSEGQP